MPWFQEIEIGRALAKLYSESSRLSFFDGISRCSADELLLSFQTSWRSHWKDSVAPVDRTLTGLVQRRATQA